MRVILLNGSPNPQGCTFTALQEIAGVLEKEGLETEILQIGKKPISGCIACYKCREKGHCVIDDAVNEFVAKAREADGFIFGSPVHYAAAGGSITSFLDRAFFSADNSVYRLKPGAAIVAARRGGCASAFDQLNKYFTITQMPIISSIYWNMVHGWTPEDVQRDEEGLQTMRVLARNMAWFLKCKQAGAAAGLTLPEQEQRLITNFIR